MKRKLLKLLLSLAIVLPVIWPCFQPRLFRVHDYTHVARLVELDRTLAGGGFPPRWSKNLGFGYGMPLFSFYAPLPYYVGELIHLLGFSFETSIKILFILVTCFSFCAMYKLAREFFSQGGATLASSLFIYGPYRAVDTYVRGSLGELFGILLITICLLAITKLIHTHKIEWTYYTAIAVAGLMLSHNLMAFMGLPLVTAWGLGLVLITEKNQKENLAKLLAGIGLGLGISAFFVVPALMEKSFTSVDELTKGSGSYEQHFVYLRQLLHSPFGYGGSIEGIYDGISFEIGKLHLALILISLGLVITRKAEKSQVYLSVFSISMILLAIFLMNSRSNIFWQYIPLISFFQFPWRFLSLILIFTSFMGGFLGNFLKKWMLVVLIIAIILFNFKLFKPEYYPDATNQIYSTDEMYIQTEMSKVIPDYIHPKLSSLVLSQEKNIEIPTQRFTIDSEQPTTIQIVSDIPQSFILQAEGRGKAKITANIFDFPGWQWWVNGKKISHTVDDQLPTMSVLVDVPPGNILEIRGKLLETPIRRVANGISMISIGLLGLLNLRRIVKCKLKN